MPAPGSPCHGPGFDRGQESAAESPPAGRRVHVPALEIADRMRLAPDGVRMDRGFGKAHDPAVSVLCEKHSLIVVSRDRPHFFAERGLIRSRPHCSAHAQPLGVVRNGVQSHVHGDSVHAFVLPGAGGGLAWAWAGLVVSATLRAQRAAAGRSTPSPRLTRRAETVGYPRLSGHRNARALSQRCHVPVVQPGADRGVADLRHGRLRCRHVLGGAVGDDPARLHGRCGRAAHVDVCHRSVGAGALLAAGALSAPRGPAAHDGHRHVARHAAADPWRRRVAEARPRPGRARSGHLVPLGRAQAAAVGDGESGRRAARAGQAEARRLDQPAGGA